MSKTIRFASAAALLATAGISLGCVRGPDVQSGLALRRVVIYRNGVGYFEREGKVDEDEVTFKVRAERVGDFLATLAVIEQGGSSVRSASFPVDVQKDDDADDDGDGDGVDPRFEVLLKPPPEKKKKKDKDHLENVKLTLDGKQHDLIVGYVAETPVWRPSYRLVVRKSDAGKPATTADLQAWGIVQNTSGEDWKGVNLTLVAGAPLAFQATLEKAVVPPRPVVTDQGEVISSVPVGETSLGDGAAPPPPPPPPAAMEAPAEDEGGTTLRGLLEQKNDSDKDAEKKDEDQPRSGAYGKRKYKAPAKSAPRGGGGGAPGSPAFAPAPMARPQEHRPNPSPPRNVRALAAVAMEAGTTHYALPFTVDVPNHSATMVLLLSKPVPGESNFLFAPDGGVPDSASHPFRVVRFTNDTPGLLERGPIAVFENGAFLGQGMVDPAAPRRHRHRALRAGAQPRRAERARRNEEGARLAQIEGGALTIERDWVTHTKYTVKNGADAEAKVLVKHPRQYNTRLNNAPKGTEDNTGTGTALVPLDVPRQRHQGARRRRAQRPAPVGRLARSPRGRRGQGLPRRPSRRRGGGRAAPRRVGRARQAARHPRRARQAQRRAPPARRPDLPAQLQHQGHREE